MKTSAVFVVLVGACCAAVPVTAVSAPMLFDFGSGSYTTPYTAEFGYYNNVTNQSTGTIANVVNAKNAATGIGLAVTRAFNGVASDATGGEVSSAAGFHENAQRDSFYINSTATGSVRLLNLPGALQYDVVLFSSRDDTFADTRITQFTIGGDVLTLDSKGNTSNVATFSRVTPQYNASLGSHVIDIDVQRTSASSHAYLNAMKVTAAGISYAAAGQVLSENFNALANAPLNQTAPWADGITVPGWYVATSSEGSFTSYKVFNGSSASQNVLMSLGTTGEGDRALGFQTQATNVSTHYGLRLVNNTDTELYEFTLGYKGEQWRWVDPGVDRLQFDYQVFDSGMGNLTAASGWNTVASLQFNSPKYNATSNQGIDGNLPENSAVLTGTARGIAWRPGQELWLRWTDIGASWQMMGIDDVSFIASPVPEPGGMLLLLVGVMAILPWRALSARSPRRTGR